ncbi:hypothetical protein Q1695_007540 [Nippostrongylus brasiliensis]|nr:hypothetical protein Q1695_007540 [Nippostrongylus brasiliensis]
MKTALPRFIKRTSLPLVVCLTMTVAFLTIIATTNSSPANKFARQRTTALEPLIIVITPTYRRPTRLADMTFPGKQMRCAACVNAHVCSHKNNASLANTLRLVPHVHWIVIEDANETVSHVEDILQRTQHDYTYVAVRTPLGYPKRGWYQRTTALQLIRNETESVMGDHTEAVVYFGDDDNSYDTRLFTDYIRNVKKLGMWAVGIVGQSAVESPKVVNGSVVGYNVKWGPKRKFAVDMAGFAINVKVVLNTTAVFGKSCQRGFGAPEPCLLEDMGFTQEDIQPFGLDEQEPGTEFEVLVWHTKTVNPSIGKDARNTHGFFFEFSR